MHQDHPAHEQKTQNHGAKPKEDEQFPVDTDVLRKIHFDTNSSLGDLARVVVMNAQSTTACAPYHEYHHGNTSVSIQDVSAFTLRSSTVACSQGEIDSFVGAMPLHLNIPQDASWQRGVYAPSASQARLYGATDPDDSTKRVGVLLEQDTQGRLVQITWYKTTDTGPLFRATPTTLEFTLVTGEDRAPSLDPADIGGWTWYYTTSLGRSV